MGGLDQLAVEGVLVPRGRLQHFAPDRLRAARERRGWSRTELADAAAVSAAAVEKWERGKAAPDPRNAGRLAAALGLAIRDLVEVPADEALTLADLRRLSGRVIADVAAAAAVPRNVISEVEAGHRPPSPELTATLAALYAVSIEQVLEQWSRSRAARLRRLRPDVESEDPT